MRSLEPALTSVANPRVKGWAKLSERKHREREGRFKLEGTHLVAEALAAGWPLECVAFDEAMGIPAELLPYAERKSGADEGAGEGLATAWIPVSPDIIAKCSETETPQPVFAIALRKEQPLEALFGGVGGVGEGTVGGAAAGAGSAAVNEDGEMCGGAAGERSGAGAASAGEAVGASGGAAGSGPVVVLDGVQDPGNVGTIIRSAAASGARAVVLGRGTADLYNAKTLRATMGTLFYVPVWEAELSALLPEARSRGAKLYGTSLQATRSCYECDLSGGDTWLLFGNEGSGLSPAVQALVDEPIIIPMTGQAESLNVAMAATILLFESQRQRIFQTTKIPD
ncbi:RNA methyltransferase [Cohnella lubricantis]|nr:RNA methyltransferase [Cohnella lubricantis]MBP2118426.1 TrmH family RNA methyltransferase [Cohnella lubricantis]